MRYYERERREFVRVRAEVPIRYRFLSHDAKFESPVAHEGNTSDLSGGGVLLRAQVPNPDWIPGLLTGRIFVGVELDLPGGEGPVRALARAAWVQASIQDSSDDCLLGLRFRPDVERSRGSVALRSLPPAPLPACRLSHLHRVG